MKIPSQANRVFKGVIFDVYQWQQEMFDGTEATFEMLKRPSTIEIMATQGDKILLSRQSQPNNHNFYSLFGGRAEENEDPLVTAKRELLEESGLESNDWELERSYQPYLKIDWEIYLFIARNCQKVTEPKLDAGEKIETLAYSFDEFLRIVESEEYRGDGLAHYLLKMKYAETIAAFKHKLFTPSV